MASTKVLAAQAPATQEGFNVWLVKNPGWDEAGVLGVG